RSSTAQVCGWGCVCRSPTARGSRSSRPSPTSSSRSPTSIRASCSRAWSTNSPDPEVTMSTSTGPHAIAARRAGERRGPRPDDDRTVLLRRAALLHLDGDWAGAQEAYEQVLAEEPGHAVALNNLGLVRA